MQKVPVILALLYAFLAGVISSQGGVVAISFGVFNLVVAFFMAFWETDGNQK